MSREDQGIYECVARNEVASVVTGTLLLMVTHREYHVIHYEYGRSMHKYAMSFRVKDDQVEQEKLFVTLKKK